MNRRLTLQGEDLDEEEKQNNGGGFAEGQVEQEKDPIIRPPVIS